jgi:hypothetical protein
MATLKGYFFPRLNIDETSADHAIDRSAASAQSGGLSPLPVPNDDALFQVFVLGTRGAGKTVFLASLFHLLSTQDRARNNFILSCSDPKSLTQLRNIFVQISNPEKDWPAGTHASQEYIFDCEHIKADQRIKLFRFRYFDFPGGFITENKSEADLSFVLTQIKRAHSILVLLDGKKIRNLLEDRLPPEGEPTIFDDLNMMAGILQQCIGKPLHFAITKSDILYPRIHSLAKIKKKLLKHNGFRNLVEHQNGRPVYLLPVSAVGDNFVEFDPVTQQMKKKPDGLIEPSYVDMSLTFTLVDYLKKISAQLRNEHPFDARDVVVRDWVWEKVLLLAPLLGLLTGPAVSLGGQVLFSQAQVSIPLQIVISAAATLGLKSLLSASGTKIKGIVEEIKWEVDSARQHISSRQSTLEVILRRQHSLALRFRELYPESLLASEESLEA